MILLSDGTAYSERFYLLGGSVLYRKDNGVLTPIKYDVEIRQ
jgi:hypothetical protein